MLGHLCCLFLIGCYLIKDNYSKLVNLILEFKNATTKKINNIKKIEIRVI